MGKPPEGGGLLLVSFLLLYTVGSNSQSNSEYGCPSQDKILPCRCSTQDLEFQIWCSHSELPRVLEGLKAVAELIGHPVDELILENNNLPSLPGHVFASLRVLRLMLRNNRLERVSSGWLEGLDDSLVELFVVEPELRSLPIDSLENLRALEAITLQSKLMKRLPNFTGLTKLRYLQVNSPSLTELTPRNFRDLPNLEQFHVFGSSRLSRLEAGCLQDLPRLKLLNISECALHWIHPRALNNLPELQELSLVANSIEDASMVGRALMDLPTLSVLHLDKNRIIRLREGSFVNFPSLSRLTMSRNKIVEIYPAAFQRLPMLRTLNLNDNMIHRIHPEFFPQRSGGNGIEELWLVNNDISHVAELRAIFEALPRLKFLEVSHNLLEKIPYGSLHGHATLERLHLDHNRLSFLQRHSFTAMPALRELRLKNNSLTNSQEAPFWNLPALKGLDLSGNYFRHVERHLLVDLPSLRRLDLSINAIGLIDPDAFLSTPALEHINISGNALSVLHPMTFRHLTNLYELDVGWNRLLEVIPGLPRNIEHLHLPMNRIVALPAGYSPNALTLPLLRTLDLSANGIERVTPGALNGMPSLRVVNFGFNALTALEDGAFDGLSRLEYLDLKYNRIGALHGRSLRPLSNILNINLRGNRLEVIRPELFQSNPRIHVLDISRNNLAQIPHATFSITRDLRELHASHNTLTEFPDSLHGLAALRVLDLSYNKINILSPKTLTSLKNLLELKLVRNRIRELREGDFDRLPRLALIDLENNDLSVVERHAIRALPELQALRLGRNRIQAIPSGAFSDLPSLQMAELQENRIQEIANNAFINVPQLLYLNISHNLLSSLDHSGIENLRSLEVLDISNNRISKIDTDTLAAMEWLVELKIDNNHICSIHGSPFDEMARLRVLSLRGNRMTSVSEDAFKKLRSSIAVLDIEGNPLACSCGMLWLRGWLHQSSAIGPRCADGSLFKDIVLSKQECQRGRHIDPVYPGCETEIIPVTSYSSSTLSHNSTSLPAWMNMKKPSNIPPHVVDYLYDDYEDYVFENGSDLSGISNLPSSSSIEPSSASPPQPLSQILDFSQSTPSTKNSSSKNVVIPDHSNQGIPPSPSSSGFTFFGVPLPSLNFNIWGNSAKKASRKEDSARSVVGRYRNYPPTEPEIHRGGFIPLPQGHSGFVPIPDPHYDMKQNETLKSTKRSNATVIKVLDERKPKYSNFTHGKTDRTSGSLSNKSKVGPRDKEELSTSSNLQATSSIRDSHKGTKGTTSSTIMVPAGAEESLISTEYFDGERKEVLPSDSSKSGTNSKEMSSRIMWTTPVTSTTVNTMKSAVVKETVTTSMDVLTDKRRTPMSQNERNRPKGFSNSTIATVDGPEKISFENVKVITPSANDQMDDPSVMKTTTLEYLETLKPTLVPRNLEASALSALLVPGGQLPVSVSGHSRPLGRPTITKVPSPYFGPSVDHPAEVAKTNLEKPASSKKDDLNSLDQSAKLIEDNDFNWYFQHYNDTDIEPFVGTAYSNHARPLFHYSSTIFCAEAYLFIRYLL